MDDKTFVRVVDGFLVFDDEGNLVDPLSNKDVYIQTRHLLGGLYETYRGFCFEKNYYHKIGTIWLVSKNPTSSPSNEQFPKGCPLKIKFFLEILEGIFRWHHESSLIRDDDMSYLLGSVLYDDK